MDKVFLVVLGLITFFAYMDAKQIITFHTLNTQSAWDLYNTYTGPAIWSMWTMVLIAIGVIWYIIFKDKSEALGISGAGIILQFFGTQDLIYFYFSKQTLAEVGCWADAMSPIKVISDLLNESCPTATSFIISGILGIIIAYYAYRWLKKAAW